MSKQFFIASGIVLGAIVALWFFGLLPDELMGLACVVGPTGALYGAVGYMAGRGGRPRLVWDDEAPAVNIAAVDDGDVLQDEATETDNDDTIQARDTGSNA